MGKSIMDLCTYEVHLKNVEEPITIEQVEVKVINGAYILSREELVIFSIPLENVLYIKSI